MSYKRILRFPRLPNLSVLLDHYNKGLEKHPYTTKAIGTGITYMFSDITAQCLESINLVNQPLPLSSSTQTHATDNQSLQYSITNPLENKPTTSEGGSEAEENRENEKQDYKKDISIEGQNEMTSLENISSRIERTVKFSLVGFLWVGPLLTAWFQVMDKFIPGKSLIPVTKKVIIDQIIQGPLMIGSMYFWTAYLNGKTLIQIYKRLEDVLYETWLNSVYVWGPVQVIQQGLIPLQYRVAFANFVSYFWDTYLSYMMMADGKAEIILSQTEEETRRSIKDEGNNESKELQKEKLKDKIKRKETLVINGKRPIIDSDYKRKRDASTPAISRSE